MQGLALVNIADDGKADRIIDSALLPDDMTFNTLDNVFDFAMLMTFLSSAVEADRN